MDDYPELWINISSSAKDLVMKLLDKNPNTRPDITEVLLHHWLSEFSESVKSNDNASLSVSKIKE